MLGLDPLDVLAFLVLGPAELDVLHRDLSAESFFELGDEMAFCPGTGEDVGEEVDEGREEE